MILCVAAHPAVDRTALVPRVVLDQILRSAEVTALAGGKGLNVARAAHLLGADVTTAFVAGGHAGQWVAEQAAREGLRPRTVASEVETRTTYIVAGGDHHSVTVYESGAAQPQGAYDELLRMIRSELLPRSSYVAIAGSVPRGVDPVWMQELVGACGDAGVPCVVDARGDSLRAALAAKPDVLKANESEMKEANLTAAAAVREGAGACVVTMASRGAMVCTAAVSWRVTVPVQRAVSTVGAGDVFTAGLVVALSRGESLEAALVQAGAASAASVLEVGAGVLDPAKAAELMPRVRVRQLAG